MADDSKPLDRETARQRIADLKRMLNGQAPLADPAPARTLNAKPDAGEDLKEETYNGTVEQLLAAFEQAIEADAGGNYWSARRLMPLLGYGERWDNFEKVVAKAQIACHQSGQVVGDHFTGVSKMVEIGSGAERLVRDVRVDRYGAYLIAQNGDSRKKQVAFAQTYFAVQTRRQELASDTSQLSFSEEQRRIMLRDEMTKHNKNLVSAAKQSGVDRPSDFAAFQNHGYKGLYGGLDRRGIQQVKGLPEKANILDHMGSTELAANLFRATQTEEKLRREKIHGKTNANAAHHEVGRQVRKAILDIGGTMPERLEAAEDIGSLRKRLSKTEPPPELD